MELSDIDNLSKINQYARLDFVQQHLSDIQIQHIEYMIQIAKNLLSGDNFQTALDLSEIAVFCAISIDDPLSLAQALTFRARMLFDVGDSQTATQYSLQALSSLRQIYHTWDEIQKFFFDRNLDFGIALVEEKIAQSHDPNTAIYELNNVEAIYRRYGYHIGLGYLFLLKGDAYKELNRFEEALTSYLHALDLLSQFDMYITELLLNLSYIYGYLNQLEEAQRYLGKAETIYREEKNELGLASIEINRAAYFRRQGKKRNLVNLYRQAQTIYQQYDQFKEVAFVKMNVATLLFTYPGHQEQAKVFLKAAIETFKEVGEKRLLSKAIGYLAFHHYLVGEYVQSKELLMQIVAAGAVEVPTDTLWQAFYYLGDIDFIEGNVTDAYENYQRTVEIIETVRSRLRTEDLIIDFINLKPDFYEPLVTTAHLLKKPVEALSWVEHTKSRGFIHILGNAKLTSRSGGDTELIEQLNEIDAQIAILDRTIITRETIDPPEILNKWEKLQEALISRRAQNISELKVRNAEVASLVSVYPIGWDEIKYTLSK